VDDIFVSTNDSILLSKYGKLLYEFVAFTYITSECSWNSRRIDLDDKNILERKKVSNLSDSPSLKLFENTDDDFHLILTSNHTYELMLLDRVGIDIKKNTKS